MFISFPKIIALIFGVIVIAKTLTDFRKKKENWQMFLFWLILWLGIIFIAFDPIIIDEIIIHFGHGTYTLGQIFGIGFVFIMFIVYRIYVKAHNLEQKLNYLVRQLALKDIKEVKKRDRTKK